MFLSLIAYIFFQYWYCYSKVKFLYLFEYILMLAPTIFIGVCLFTIDQSIYEDSEMTLFLYAISVIGTYFFSNILQKIIYGFFICENDDVFSEIQQKIFIFKNNPVLISAILGIYINKNKNWEIKEENLFAILGLIFFSGFSTFILQLSLLQFYKKRWFEIIEANNKKGV